MYTLFPSGNSLPLWVEIKEMHYRYMLLGGMPYLLNLKEDRQQKDYLAQLFNEVYIKDIVEREGIERLSAKLYSAAFISLYQFHSV